MNSYDTLILGAGIAGITAGIYLKRSNLKSLVLDKGAPGGKLNNIHRIDNYPGTAKIAGPDLAMSLYTQANELGVEFGYGSVYEVRKVDEGFLIKTDGGDYLAKTVIVATGVENKKLGIPGEDSHIGRGVSYCATCDGNFFKGKEVVVIGNADHAVEDAIYLSSICAKVHLFHPAPLETTEAHEAEIRSLENVEIKAIDKALSIEGEVLVEKLIYEENGEKKEIETSAVFPLYGEKSSSAFLSPLGVETNKGFIKVDAEMKTNVPGVYACGDIIDKKLRQLVNAAGEASVAATSAIAYVHSLRK